MHVMITAASELWPYHKRDSLGWKRRNVDSQAKKPSSSSLRLGAGNGAPGPSLCVGSRTYPALLNGLIDCSLDKIGVEEVVVTGMSGSRRDQPMEFIESRKEVEAIGYGAR